MLILKQGLDEIKIETEGMKEAVEMTTDWLPYFFANRITVEYKPNKKEAPAEDETKETAGCTINEHLDNNTIDEDVQELEPKEKPEKDLAVLAELLADGMSKKRIADHFCVSMSTIYNWCNELDELNDVYDKSGVK